MQKPPRVNKKYAYIFLCLSILLVAGYASAQQQGHPWSEILLPVGGPWIGLDAEMLEGHHWSDVAALMIWGMSGTNIFNLNSGNVGIGTNSPSQELDVAGDLRVRGLSGCDTIDTDASGNLACGTDDDGVGACSECDPSFVNEGQPNSITSPMIVDGAVSGADIADGSVGSADIADGSVGSADIADGSVGSADIADGSVGSADISSGQVQERVSGTCAAGSSIRAISPAGGVTCEPDDTGAGGDTDWTENGGNVYRASGNVGIGTSAPTQKLDVNGNINLGGASPTYKITNVASPTGTDDVATKGYVDAAGAGSPSCITTTRGAYSGTSCGGSYPAAYCPAGWSITSSWTYCTYAAMYCCGNGANQNYRNDWTETLCCQ